MGRNFLFQILISIVTMGVTTILSPHPSRSETELNVVSATSDKEIESLLDHKMLIFDKGILPSVKDVLESVSKETTVEFELAPGVDGPVRVRPNRMMSLRAFLDQTLYENGYHWIRFPGSRTIRVERDITTQRFWLNDSQYLYLQKARSPSKRDHPRLPGTWIRVLIFGKETVPGQGVKYRLEGRELVVTDSRYNIGRVQKFLERYSGSGPPPTEPIRYPPTGTARHLPSGSAYSGGVYRRIYHPQHRTSRDLVNALRGTVLFAQ